MYRQLDLFGDVPEGKPVEPAEPRVTAADKSSTSAAPAVKLHVSRPAEADHSQPAPVAVSSARPSAAPTPAETPAGQEITAETPENVHTPTPTVTFVENTEDAIEEVLSEPSPSRVAIGSAPKTGKRGRKSQKEMEAEAAAIEIPPDEVLFKKQYYSIGEVSRMFKLNSSLLRYWESEFDIIKPRKNRKGDRHFRPEDIKNLYLIHHLLRARKYTIEGAKTYLKKNKNKASENFEIIQKLEKIKQFLLELKAGL